MFQVPTIIIIIEITSVVSAYDTEVLLYLLCNRHSKMWILKYQYSIEVTLNATVVDALLHVFLCRVPTGLESDFAIAEDGIMAWR